MEDLPHRKGGTVPGILLEVAAAAAILQAAILRAVMAAGKWFRCGANRMER